MIRVTETDPGHNRFTDTPGQLLSLHTSCVDFGMPIQFRCLECLALEAGILSRMLGEQPSDILTARLARVQNLRFQRILEVQQAERVEYPV